MRVYLTDNFALKSLETPNVYDILTDELYELDEAGFEYLRKCADDGGHIAEAGEFTDYCLSEGILSTEPQRKKLPQVIEPPSPSATPSLRYLELQVTQRCNLRCRHCYVKPSNEKTDTLTIKEIKSTLSAFQEMQGLRLLITGGEPLVHEQFKEINSILPDYALRKILFTNGLLLSNMILRELNVQEIQISIDGMEVAHDSIRGKGTFNKSMSAINRAIHHGFDVSISTMVHALNLDDFNEMDELFREIKVRDWTVDIPCGEGSLKENKELQLRPDTSGKYLRYGFGEGLHGGGEGYACGHHLMSVMSDGNCAKCAFYTASPVGHLRDGLARCWSKVEHIKLEELECDCAHIKQCRGGCRYRAGMDKNKLKKDLYRCSLYDII